MVGLDTTGAEEELDEGCAAWGVLAIAGTLAVNSCATTSATDARREWEELAGGFPDVTPPRVVVLGVMDLADCAAFQSEAESSTTSLSSSEDSASR